MILEVFAVMDKATNVFEKPVFMLTRAEAIRAFSAEVNNKESMFYKHPLDYHLYHLGTFNQDNGTFTSESILDLGSAQNYIDESTQPE